MQAAKFSVLFWSSWAHGLKRHKTVTVAAYACQICCPEMQLQPPLLRYFAGPINCMSGPTSPAPALSWEYGQVQAIPVPTSLEMGLERDCKTDRSMTAIGRHPLLCSNVEAAPAGAQHVTASDGDS